MSCIYSRVHTAFALLWCLGAIYYTRKKQNEMSRGVWRHLTRARNTLQRKYWEHQTTVKQLGLPGVELTKWWWWRYHCLSVCLYASSYSSVSVCSSLSLCPALIIYTIVCHFVVPFHRHSDTRPGAHHVTNQMSMMIGRESSHWQY